MNKQFREDLAIIKNSIPNHDNSNSDLRVPLALDNNSKPNNITKANSLSFSKKDVSQKNVSQNQQATNNILTGGMSGHQYSMQNQDARPKIDSRNFQDNITSSNGQIKTHTNQSVITQPFNLIQTQSQEQGRPRALTHIVQYSGSLPERPIITSNEDQRVQYTYKPVNYVASSTQPYIHPQQVQMNPQAIVQQGQTQQIQRHASPMRFVNRSYSNGTEVVIKGIDPKPMGFDNDQKDKQKAVNEFNKPPQPKPVQVTPEKIVAEQSKPTPQPPIQEKIIADTVKAVPAPSQEEKIVIENLEQPPKPKSHQRLPSNNEPNIQRGNNQNPGVSYLTMTTSNTTIGSLGTNNLFNKLIKNAHTASPKNQDYISKDHISIKNNFYDKRAEVAVNNPCPCPNYFGYDSPNSDNKNKEALIENSKDVTMKNTLQFTQNEGQSTSKWSKLNNKQNNSFDDGDLMIKSSFSTDDTKNKKTDNIKNEDCEVLQSYMLNDPMTVNMDKEPGTPSQTDFSVVKDGRLSIAGSDISGFNYVEEFNQNYMNINNHLMPSKFPDPTFKSIYSKKDNNNPTYVHAGDSKNYQCDVMDVIPEKHCFESMEDYNKYHKDRERVMKFHNERRDTPIFLSKGQEPDNKQNSGNSNVNHYEHYTGTDAMQFNNELRNNMTKKLSFGVENPNKNSPSTALNAKLEQSIETDMQRVRFMSIEQNQTPSWSTKEHIQASPAKIKQTLQEYKLGLSESQLNNISNNQASIQEQDMRVKCEEVMIENEKLKEMLNEKSERLNTCQSESIELQRENDAQIDPRNNKVQLKEKYKQILARKKKSNQDYKEKLKLSQKESKAWERNFHACEKKLRTSEKEKDLLEYKLRIEFEDVGRKNIVSVFFC